MKCSLFFSQRGFNLVELLTTVSVVGVLSVIGIKSYRSQTDKARAAEAKHSLSYVYSAEQKFREAWGTYHENLVVIGAIPSGAYHYDIGFSKDATINDGSQPLDKLRFYPLKSSLNIKECINFKQICEGDCEGLTPNKHYFKAAGNCSVNGCGSNCLAVANLPSLLTGLNAEAYQSTFKAVAIGDLKNLDIWSIDHKKDLNNEKDGTQ